MQTSGFKAHDASDIFRAFFDGGDFGGFFGGGSRGPKKGKSIQHVLQISLEDMYKGIKKKLKVTRNIMYDHVDSTIFLQAFVDLFPLCSCQVCQGNGTKSGKAPGSCRTCNGSGVKVTVHRMGPMIQQMQSVCPTCQGEGTAVSNDDKCGACRGGKMIEQSNVIQVDIRAGVIDGEKIIMHGQADEAPGLEPGDLIFVIRQKPHDVFHRGGSRSADLVVEKDITLTDALCGFETTIKHLDDRQLLVRVKPGERVIKPGDLFEIKKEGMPVKDSLEKGNLYVKFNVIFPDKISHAQAKQLKSIGLPTSPTAASKDAEEVSMSYYDTMSEKRKARNRGGRQHDDDAMDVDDEDDGRGHRPGVQCSQS
jgi:DnaJ homolog subfamily A member 2